MDIENYYDRIYRYCYYKVNNRTLAEDLTQETFLRFLKSDCEQAESYLYTIARNLCIDEYRKTRPESLDNEEGMLMQGSHEDELIEKIRIDDALSRLPEEEKELIVLRYVNDEPISEICRLTGISRFAVYRRIKEAKAKLEVLLERGEDERQ